MPSLSGIACGAFLILVLILAPSQSSFAQEFESKPDSDSRSDVSSFVRKRDIYLATADSIAAIIRDADSVKYDYIMRFLRGARIAELTEERVHVAYEQFWSEHEDSVGLSPLRTLALEKFQKMFIERFDRERLYRLLVPVINAAFSPDELEESVEFYESSAGKQYAVIKEKQIRDFGNLDVIFMKAYDAMKPKEQKVLWNFQFRPVAERALMYDEDLFYAVYDAIEIYEWDIARRVYRDVVTMANPWIYGDGKKTPSAPEEEELTEDKELYEEDH